MTSYILKIAGRGQILPCFIIRSFIGLLWNFLLHPLYFHTSSHSSLSIISSCQHSFPFTFLFLSFVARLWNILPFIIEILTFFLLYVFLFEYFFQSLSETFFQHQPKRPDLSFRAFRHLHFRGQLYFPLALCESFNGMT